MALFLEEHGQSSQSHCQEVHYQVNGHSLFFDAKSILASTNNQRLSGHVNQWNIQEVS